MIVLSEDALKYIKKMCMRRCLGMILIGAMGYTILKTLSDQEEKITDLTKKVEELKSKGE